MTWDASARIARIRALQAAAVRVRAHEALYAKEVAAATYLSPEGVHLALSEHLEVEATDEELERLASRVHRTDEVTVILSASVFVGALRALSIAVASADAVVVRPSSREPYFTRALVHELADPLVRVDEALDVAAVTRGEIHVYGRDETIDAIRARARANVPVRGHGTGMGVAVVRGDDMARAASLVARDVVPFDQRGCLSPRVVLVSGDAGRASAFGRALAAELERFRTAVPRGFLTEAEGAEAARYIGTMTFAGELFGGAAYAVGVGEELTVPPVGRHVHVIPFGSEDDAVRALTPIARFVAAVGHDAPLGALMPLLARARASALGDMQRPRLDGPVDLRGVAPLS